MSIGAVGLLFAWLFLLKKHKNNNDVLNQHGSEHVTDQIVGHEHENLQDCDTTKQHNGEAHHTMSKNPVNTEGTPENYDLQEQFDEVVEDVLDNMSDEE